MSVRLTSLGFSFGRRAISSFTACMTKDVAKQLATRGKVSEAGFDIGFACGAGLQDRAELVGGSCTGGMVGTVGVNKVSGGLMDLSFAGGGLAAARQSVCLSVLPREMAAVDGNGVSGD